MLVVQQPPRMGSSQPPSDPYLPFGYSVDADQEPIPDPPEPAPGAPLLSDMENRLLSSFFENLNSNQYNMTSFGEGLVFENSWLSLPPQLMGTTSSYGQEPGASTAAHPDPLINHDHIDMSRIMTNSQLMPPPPPPPHPPPAAAPPSFQHITQPPAPSSSQPPAHHSHHSEDVLNAAATLVQNGSSSRASGGIFGDQDVVSSRRSVVPPVGHLRHQPLEEFRAESRRGVAGTNEHDRTFTDWMWGPQDRRGLRSAPIPDYHFGSDANFNPLQGYTPDVTRGTVESMQQEQLKMLDCFEVAHSAPTTRPTSPTNGYNPSPAISQNLKTSNATRRDEPGAPPSKRRKSRASRDDDEEDTGADEGDDDGAVAKPTRRRKPKQERPAAPIVPLTENGPSTASKRRKSAASGTKAQRENLSEEQKRENHIRSEQKRRTLIKEGFDDLCDLVPGLRGGGFSKSTMLTMAADWLEELIEGNEKLTSQLSDVQGR